MNKKKQKLIGISRRKTERGFLSFEYIVILTVLAGVVLGIWTVIGGSMEGLSSSLSGWITGRASSIGSGSSGS